MTNKQNILININKYFDNFLNRIYTDYSKVTTIQILKI